MSTPGDSGKMPVKPGTGGLPVSAAFGVEATLEVGWEAPLVHTL
jgi:hypothetical protein